MYQELTFSFHFHQDKLFLDPDATLGFMLFHEEV